jgi:hypothetical protein
MAVLDATITMCFSNIDFTALTPVVSVEEQTHLFIF